MKSDDFKEFLKKFKQRHPEHYQDLKQEAMPILKAPQTNRIDECELAEDDLNVEEIIDDDEPENWWDK